MRPGSSSNICSKKSQDQRVNRPAIQTDLSEKERNGNGRSFDCVVRKLREVLRSVWTICGSWLEDQVVGQFEMEPKSPRDGSVICDLVPNDAQQRKQNEDWSPLSEQERDCE